MGKQDTATGEGTAEEVVGGEEAGGVHGVAEGNVDKDALHDDEDRGAINCDADGGHDPVDVGAGGPGEEEEADGWAKRGEKGGDEAFLLSTEAEFFNARVHVVVEVAEVGDDTNNAGDEDAEEDETELANGHAIVDGVDKREDLKDYKRGRK